MTNEEVSSLIKQLLPDTHIEVAVAIGHMEPEFLVPNRILREGEGEEEGKLMGGRE